MLSVLRCHASFKRENTGETGLEEVRRREGQKRSLKKRDRRDEMIFVIWHALKLSFLGNQPVMEAKRPLKPVEYVRRTLLDVRQSKRQCTDWSKREIAFRSKAYLKQKDPLKQGDIECKNLFYISGSIFESKCIFKSMHLRK